MKINVPRKRRSSRVSAPPRPSVLAQIKRTKRRGLRFTKPQSLKSVKRNLTMTAAMLLAASNGRKKTALKEVRRTWRDIEPPEEIEFNKGRSAGVVKGIDTSLYSAGGSSGRAATDVPFIRTDSKIRRYTGNIGQSQHRFRTNFVCGIPSTASIRQLARLNGSSDITVLDTQYSTEYSEGGSRRPNTQLAAGFNQKQIACYSDAHHTVKDLYDAYDLDNYSFAQNKLQRPYGLAQSIKTHYRILNAGTYFMNVVTIRMCAPRDPANRFHDAITNICPTPSEFSGSTPTNKLPIKYTLSGYTTAIGLTYGRVDPKATPMLSPEFNKHYETVKTFTKRLMPGEVWDFTCEQHLGSGIRLDELKQIHEEAPTAGFGYLYLIEHHGIPCEAVSQTALGTDFIGTSPSYLSVEFKRSYKAVLQSDPTYNQLANEGGIIPNSAANHQRLAIRAFTKKDPGDITNRIVNFNLSEIGYKGEENTKVFIPAISDAWVGYADGAGEQNPNA